jgi:hypothetical protein
VILRARVASGGERDMSAGTSEHTDRASDLLRRERERERERERVLLSEQECPSAERERVVSERRHRRAITMCVSDVRKKGDPGWQSKGCCTVWGELIVATTGRDRGWWRHVSSGNP